MKNSKKLITIAFAIVLIAITAMFVACGDNIVDDWNSRKDYIESISVELSDGKAFNELVPDDLVGETLVVKMKDEYVDNSGEMVDHCYRIPIIQDMLSYPEWQDSIVTVDTSDAFVVSQDGVDYLMTKFDVNVSFSGINVVVTVSQKTTNFVLVNSVGTITLVRAGSYSNNNSYTRLVLPSYYKGTIVTSIAEDAFLPNNIPTLQEVVIPASITSIADGAFLNSPKLQKIDILSPIINLGQNAFDNCVALQEINILGNSTNYYSDNGVVFDNNDNVHIWPMAKSKDFTVTTQLQDGSQLDTTTVTYGMDYSLPIPSMVGQAFSGYVDSNNNNVTDDNGDSLVPYKYVKDTTAIATFDIVKMTVRFYDKGVLQQEQQVNYGTNALPPILTSVSHNLVGWIDLSGNGGTLENITTDMDFEAAWEIKEFDIVIPTTNKVDFDPLPTKVEYGSSITIDANLTTPYTQSTLKVYVNGTQISLPHTTPVTQNLTITINDSEIKLNVYIVTFVSDNPNSQFDSGNTKQVSVLYGESILNTVGDFALPRSEDKEFVGWADNSNNSYDLTTQIYQDLELKAVWNTRYYTVRFKDGNDILDIQTIGYGEAITYTPTLEDKYNFVGWQYFNGTTISWDKLGWGNIDGSSDKFDLIVDKEVKKFEVTFEQIEGIKYTINGNDYESYYTNVPYDDNISFSITIDTAHNQSQYTVWSNNTQLTLDGQGYYVVHNITKNINITTKDVKINIYRINFYSQNLIIDSVDVKHGEKIKLADIPTGIRTGYSYTIWNGLGDTDYTIQQLCDLIITGDLTDNNNQDEHNKIINFSIKWEANIYTVHFETNGALNTIDNAQGIKYNSINILILPIPIYEVYQKFAVGDWYFIKDNNDEKFKVNVGDFQPLDINADDAIITLYAWVLSPYMDINPTTKTFSKNNSENNDMYLAKFNINTDNRVYTIASDIIEVTFLATSSSYSQTNMNIIIAQRTTELVLRFYNFKFTASSGNNAVLYEKGVKSFMLTIDNFGTSLITAGNSNKNLDGINTIDAKNTNVYFSGQGKLSIIASSGASVSNDMEGNNGGNGIVANSVEFGEKASLLSVDIVGGNGGNGGTGSQGMNSGANGGDTSTILPDTTGSGRDGDKGNNGRVGGKGGAAISANIVTIKAFTNLNITGGSGGIGGNGGLGRNGGNGGSAISDLWMATGGAGGSGGSGGAGGAGGLGGYAIEGSLDATKTNGLIITSGQGGNGGTGGNASYGGNGGQGRSSNSGIYGAKNGGRGGDGGTGGDGGNGATTLQAVSGSSNFAGNAGAKGMHGSGGNGGSGGAGGRSGKYATSGAGGNGGNGGYGGADSKGGNGGSGGNGAYGGNNGFLSQVGANGGAGGNGGSGGSGSIGGNGGNGGYGGDGFYGTNDVKGWKGGNGGNGGRGGDGGSGQVQGGNAGYGGVGGYGGSGGDSWGTVGIAGFDGGNGGDGGYGGAGGDAGNFGTSIQGYKGSGGNGGSGGYGGSGAWAWLGGNTGNRGASRGRASDGRGK